MLQPYLLYLKIGLAAVAILVIGGLWWWISSAFTERNNLRIDVAAKSAQITQYQDAMIVNAKLREDLTNAIKNVKINSEVFINEVDTSKPPVVPDGTHVMLVVGGVPKAVPSVPAYTNSTTNSRSPIIKAN